MDHRTFNILSTGSMYDELIGKAYLHKIHIEEIAFIQTETCLSPEKIHLIHTLSKEKRTVIFTSKQAVRAVGAILTNIPDWDIYCINGATQKEVLKRWPQIHIAGTAVNGATLATLITEKPVYTKEILFFCGNQRLNKIPDRLADACIPLKEVIVYRTIPTPMRIEKEYDGIFFFSPSTVHSFFSMNTSGKAILFSIGETTTSALKRYTDDTHIITAGQPDKKELVDLAIDYFEQINK